MKDFLRYFKTDQLTDAECVEQARKSLRYLQYIKKLSRGFILGGIAWMVFGGFAVEQVIEQAGVIANALQSSLYLVGLNHGITIGAILISFLLAGFSAILSGIIQPILWHRNKLLVEYYDKLQTELAKPK